MKKYKRRLLFLICASLFCYQFYCFFIYPKVVAEETINSFQVGDSLVKHLKANTIFIKNFSRSSYRVISFEKRQRRKRRKSCGHIFFSRKGIKYFTIGESPFAGRSKMKIIDGIEQLPKMIIKHKKLLSDCNTMTTTLMPTFFYRCTITIRYDEKFMVTDVEQKRCWD